MTWYLECGQNRVAFSEATFAIGDQEIESAVKNAESEQVWLVCYDDFAITIQQSALRALADTERSLFLDLFPAESEVDGHVINYVGNRLVGGALRDLDDAVDFACKYAPQVKDMLHVSVTTTSGQNPMILTALGAARACQVLTAIQITSAVSRFCLEESR